MAVAPPALAQLSTSTVRGNVTVGAAPAKPGGKVLARNTANGTTASTTIREDGSYVLPGLMPGTYVIEVSADGAQTRTEPITLQVGETASLNLALGTAVRMEQVIVVAQANRLDVKNSEVGTNISQQQIANLPQVTRNFLSFADLAPGVNFDVAAQTASEAAERRAERGQREPVHRRRRAEELHPARRHRGLDHVAGQPVPQSAVSEYKVITQNYKAEFDQVSSAAVTAVTKSGTNEFHGSRSGTTPRPTGPRRIRSRRRRAAGREAPQRQQQQFAFDRRRDREGQGALLLRLRGQEDRGAAPGGVAERQPAAQRGHRPRAAR
jgi:hypothetical protein